MGKLAYQRALLKVSGEVLMGPQPYGIDLEMVGRVADDVIGCVKVGALSGTRVSAFRYRRSASPS